MFHRNGLISNRATAAVTQLRTSPVNVFTCPSGGDEWLSGRRPQCSRRTVVLRHRSPVLSHLSLSVTRRVDHGVHAGVGALHPAGHPQHAHALPGVVAVRGGRLPGGSDQWGRAGLPVHHIRADRCRLHGKKKKKNFFNTVGCFAKHTRDTVMTDFMHPPPPSHRSSRWDYRQPAVSELGTLSAQETRRGPSCRARSTSYADVRRNSKCPECLCLSLQVLWPFN